MGDGMDYRRIVLPVAFEANIVIVLSGQRVCHYIVDPGDVCDVRAKL